MGIIAWIIFGLIAGIIAKLIMPGRDGGGFFLTCILGIVGAVVGGWLATMFGIGGSISGFNLHSFLVAVVGAILVLGVFRLLRRDKIFIRRIAIQMPLSAFTSERILDTSPEIATFFNKPFTVGIFGIKQVIDRRINAEAMT
ncbi:transglycosylase associated protein [Escherichia coli]|uniref:Transglycosylase associated protein n=3 Tax=Escherichia coli TaxID=562 RepID=A0A484WNK9_ECOLX|nr:transglycosylase associated protein [Escherichia coli]